MANFTAEQREYIATTISVAIGAMEDKVGSILGRGEAMQQTLQGIIEKHNGELHANADRVTELVDKANKAHEKLEGSTARIDDSNGKIQKAEEILTDLKANLKVFEECQTASFADHAAQLKALSDQAETAMGGLDAKLSAAVATTRADCKTEFDLVNEKVNFMHTYCTGIQAEVQRMLSQGSGGGGGKGAGGTGFEGKGSGKGAGIDKKDVAV